MLASLWLLLMLKERCVIHLFFFDWLSPHPPPLVILSSSSFYLFFSPFLSPTCFVMFALSSWLLTALLSSSFPSFPLQLYPITHHSIPLSPSPLIPRSTLLSILIVGCVVTNVLLSFSPALVLLIGIYSPCWSSVGGQTGIHYRVYVCACVHTGDESEFVCVHECEREREGVKETLGVWESPCVCMSHRMHLLYCIWLSWPRMHVFSLIRQIGVDAMRGDERRASWPWQEIRGSSDARLHQRCVAPVSPRHTHTVTCWDTVTLCTWACLC